nr:MAG: RNA-dependent RNA polymerase [XiangYun bunya-arena-like virus 8]
MSKASETSTYISSDDESADFSDDEKAKKLVLQENAADIDLSKLLGDVKVNWAEEAEEDMSNNLAILKLKSNTLSTYASNQLLRISNLDDVETPDELSAYLNKLFFQGINCWSANGDEGLCAADAIAKSLNIEFDTVKKELKGDMMMLGLQSDWFRSTEIRYFLISKANSKIIIQIETGCSYVEYYQGDNSLEPLIYIWFSRHWFVGSASNNPFKNNTVLKLPNNCSVMTRDGVLGNELALREIANDALMKSSGNFITDELSEVVKNAAETGIKDEFLIELKKLMTTTNREAINNLRGKLKVFHYPKEKPLELKRSDILDVGVKPDYKFSNFPNKGVHMHLKIFLKFNKEELKNFMSKFSSKEQLFYGILTEAVQKDIPFSVFNSGSNGFRRYFFGNYTNHLVCENENLYKASFDADCKIASIKEFDMNDPATAVRIWENSGLAVGPMRKIVMDPTVHLISLPIVQEIRLKSWNQPFESEPPIEYVPLVQTIAMITNLFVEEKDDKFIVDFDLSNPCKEGWKLKTGHNSLTFNKEDARKLPHELILDTLFKTEGDVPLGRIMKKGDDSDRFTPDIIDILNKKQAWVCELKTTVTRNQLAARYNEAINTYMPHLASRCSNELYIKLFGLAVSFNDIVTNLPMNDNRIMEICLHYTVGHRIMEYLETSKRIEPRDNETEDRMLLVQEELDKLCLKEDDADELIITRKFLKHLDEDFDPKRPIDILVKHIKECSEVISSGNLEERSKDKTAFVSVLKEEENEETGSRRNDLKAPIQLPFVYPKDHRRKLDKPPTVLGDNALTSAWNQARDFYLKNPENFISSESLESGIPQRIKDNLEADKKQRKKNKRVFVKLTESERASLALSGVGAKNLKNYGLIKEKKKKDKLPFSWKVPINDIDLFITNQDIWKNYGTGDNLYIKNASELVTRASNILGDSVVEENHNFIKEMMNVNLFKALTVLDEIAQECNYSRNQNCSSKEFILKRLKTVDGWLLISPTRGSEHIFFSLMVNKETTSSVMLPFKIPEDHGDLWIYPFVQLDADRIDQYIYAPFKAMVFVFRQMALFCPIADKELNSDSRYHSLAQILFYLEDKRQTSTNIQLFRYVYMDLISENNMLNPYKVLKKIDPRPKSRLLVWAVTRMSQAAIIMMKNNPIIGRERTLADESEDVTKNLISFVTMREIPTFECAVELSYYCNLHNKARKNKTHDEFEIMKKILEEDYKYKNVRKECVGWAPCDDPKEHEFDHSFTTFCAKKTRAFLEKTDSNYEANMKRTIIRRLSNVTLLDLATTKSSAINISKDKMFSPDMIEVKQQITKKKKKAKKTKKQKTESTEVDKKEENEREFRERDSRKCMEAANEMLLLLGTNYPFTKLSVIFDKVKEQGGILSNLFSKEQIGGAREIFRLEFWSRLIMKFLETVATCIDERLPNALLTKGTHKTQRSREHYYKCRAVLKHGKTAINSADKKRWAQNFVMLMFATTFKELLPEDLIESFCSCLNLVTTKGIELPTEMCRQFLMNPEIHSMNPMIKKLKDEFLGLDNEHWFLDKKYGKVIKNRTNMMQGQCHVVSDVYHASYLIGVEDLMMKVVDHYNRSNNATFNCHITTKCSSDDSSHIVTVFNKKEGELVQKSCLYMAKHICLMILKLYPYVGVMVNYSKTTIANTKYVEEFNSVWLFRNTIIAAPIKHLYTVITTPCVSNFEMRVYEMQNLLMELFESCGSSYLCSMVQICQAYAHYSLMGALTNEFFLEWMKYCIKEEHPMAGFFLLQPSACCGLLPLEFSKYIACRNSASSLKVEDYLFKTDGFEYTTDFGRVCSIKITKGQESKYKAFKSKFNINMEEIEKKTSSDLFWLYEKPNTMSRTKLSLDLKVLSPGMADAMIYKKPHKIHTSSCYIFSEPCLTKKEKGKEPQKMNFFNLSQSIQLPNIPEKEVDETMARLFPNNIIFEDVYNFCIQNNIVVKSKRIKKREIKLFFGDIERDGYLPLKDVLAYKWCGVKERSVNKLVSSWLHHSKVLPWLQDTLEETLAHPQCPFESILSLKGYIEHRSKDTVKVRCYTSGQIMTSPIETLKSIIKNSPWPGCMLKSSDELREQSEKANYITNDEIIKAQITLLMDSPFERDEAILAIKGILHSYDTSKRKYGYSTPFQEKLTLLALHFKDKGNENFKRALYSSKEVVFGHWVRTAPKDSDGRRIGDSVWSGFLCTVRIDLIFKNDVVKMVVVNEKDLERLIKTKGALTELIRSLSGRTEDDKSFAQYYYCYKFKYFTIKPQDNFVRIRTISAPLIDIDVGKTYLNYDLIRKRIDLKDNEGQILLSCKFESFVTPNRPAIPKGYETSKKYPFDWVIKKWFTCEAINLEDLKKNCLELEKDTVERTWFFKKLKESLEIYDLNIADDTNVKAQISTISLEEPLQISEEVGFLEFEDMDDIIYGNELIIQEDESVEQTEIVNENEEFLVGLGENLEEMFKVPDIEEFSRKSCRLYQRTFRALIHEIQKEYGNSGINCLTIGWRESDPLCLKILSRGLGKQQLPDLSVLSSNLPSRMMILFRKSEEATEDFNRSRKDTDDDRNDSME